MKADSLRKAHRRYVRILEANRALTDESRDREIRQTETAASIRLFAGAFRIALRDLHPRESSGLVEWQDYWSNGRIT